MACWRGSCPLWCFGSLVISIFVLFISHIKLPIAFTTLLKIQFFQPSENDKLKTAHIPLGENVVAQPHRGASPTVRPAAIAGYFPDSGQITSLPVPLPGGHPTVGGGAAAGLCCRGEALTPKVAPPRWLRGVPGVSVSGETMRAGFVGTVLGMMPVSGGIGRVTLSDAVLGVGAISPQAPRGPIWPSE